MVLKFLVESTYNVPPRTGVNLTAETTLSLAHKYDNIVATKEASGMLPQIMQIIKNRPDNFSVISGDDVLSLPIVAIGGQGVISVAANAMPHEVSSVIRNSLNSNFAEANAVNLNLLDFIDTLFAEGSPSGVKAALNILGLSQNVLRLPLVPVSDDTYNKLKSIMQSIKKL